MTAEPNQHDFLPSIWSTSETFPLYSRSSPPNYVSIKLAPIDPRDSTSQLSPQRLPPFRELFTDDVLSATRPIPLKLSTARKQLSLPSIQELFHDEVPSVDLRPAHSPSNNYSPSWSPTPPRTNFASFLLRLKSEETPVHDFPATRVDFLPTHSGQESGIRCLSSRVPSGLSFSGGQKQLQDTIDYNTAPRVPSPPSRPAPSQVRRVEMQPLFTYEPLPGAQVIYNGRQPHRTQASKVARLTGTGADTILQRPAYLPPPYASLDSAKADIPDLAHIGHSVYQTQSATTVTPRDDPILPPRKQRRPKTRVTSNARLCGSSALPYHTMQPQYAQEPASLPPVYQPKQVYSYDPSTSFRAEKQEMVPPYEVWDAILPGLLDEDESRRKRVKRMRHSRGTTMTMTKAGGDI